MVVVAGYAIAVAVLMLTWWGVSVRRGALRRSDRSRIEMILHLAAETASAATLLVGGILGLVASDDRVLLVGLGMLLYTVIASPGYFLSRRENGPASVFAVLLVTTVGAIVTLLVT